MGKSWLVYIVETESGRLYTGITTDLERRFNEHKVGSSGKGAKFFNISAPKVIRWNKKFANRSEASSMEYQIKQMSRKEKELLIKKGKNYD